MCCATALRHDISQKDNQASHAPIIRPRQHDMYLRLIDFAQTFPPIVTAVAHPCDDVPLEGAVEARKLYLIEPILLGPPTGIRDVAARHGIDIIGIPIIEAAHSHDSAAKAVALVREAKAGVLMKGSLHTDELMCGVIARDTGIRTERRISHRFVMDVPGHLDP
jgi:phosphate acetyltransferase